MSGCLMLLLFQASHRRRHRTLGKEKTMDTTCRHEKTSVHRWTAAESSPEPFLCSHPTTSNCPPIHPSPLKLSRLETYTQAQDLQPPPFSASKKAHAMNCIPGSIVVETTTGFDSLHIHQTTSIGKCLRGSKKRSWLKAPIDVAASG